MRNIVILAFVIGVSILPERSISKDTKAQLAPRAKEWSPKENKKDSIHKQQSIKKKGKKGSSSAEGDMQHAFVKKTCHLSTAHHPNTEVLRLRRMLQHTLKRQPKDHRRDHRLPPNTFGMCPSFGESTRVYTPNDTVEDPAPRPCRSREIKKTSGIQARRQTMNIQTERLPQ